MSKNICSKCKEDYFPEDDSFPANSCPLCRIKDKNVECKTKNPRRMHRKLMDMLEDLKYTFPKDKKGNIDKKETFIIIQKDEVGNVGHAEFKIKGEKSLDFLKLKKKKSNLNIFVGLFIVGVVIFALMSVIMGYGGFIKIPVVQYLFPLKYIIFLFIVYTLLIAITSLAITRYDDISGKSIIEIRANGEVYAGKNDQFSESIEKMIETLSYELTFKVTGWITKPESQNKNISSIKPKSKECENYVKHTKPIMVSDFNEIFEYSKNACSKNI